MQPLSIGDVAGATGLTVRALRHYQQLGLLAPAGVDPGTRYRAYGPEQLERAQEIARLRRLGLPLARIRDYLAAASAEDRRQLLQNHRVELDTRLRSTGQLQLELDRLIGPAHERRNLGFDEPGPDGILPASWDGGGERYDRARDTSASHSPGASGRIAFRGGEPGEDDWATFVQYATPVPFRGGRVRYLGWLRTRDVASGWAGLWLRVDGPDREVLEFDNLGQVPPDRSLKGTNDWTAAEIVLPVAAEAITIAFGVVLVGDGVLWADDLSFEALPA